jgi:hypothetical protein
MNPECVKLGAALKQLNLLSKSSNCREWPNIRPLLIHINNMVKCINADFNPDIMKLCTLVKYLDNISDDQLVLLCFMLTERFVKFQML